MASHHWWYGQLVRTSESPEDNLIRCKLEHKWVSPHILVANKKSFTNFLYGNPSIPPVYSDSHYSPLSRLQKDYSWFIHMSKQMTTLNSFLSSDLTRLSQWPKSTFLPSKFSLCDSTTMRSRAILDRSLQHLFFFLNLLQTICIYSTLKQIFIIEIKEFLGLGFFFSFAYVKFSDSSSSCWY